MAAAKKTTTKAVSTAAPEAVTAPVKRGRGRPPKQPVIIESPAENKRRGRPPKTAVPAAVSTVEALPVKRGRGRPKKETVLVPAEAQSEDSSTQQYSEAEVLLLEEEVVNRVLPESQDDLLSFDDLTPEPPKRGRGRPPKEPKLQLVNSHVSMVPILPETEKHTPSKRPLQPQAAERTHQEEIPAAVPELAEDAVPKRRPGRPPANRPIATPEHVRPVAQPQAQPKKRRSRKWLRYTVAIILLLVLPAAGWFYYQSQHRTVPASTADARLIQEVSTRVLLPSGEKPSISTVVDSTKVTQSFLTGARNGDKVLLFFQAGKAIVYRPSTHQVINMGPIQAPKPRVFVRKGNDLSDTSKIVNEINSTNNFVVTSQDVSPIKNYTKTVVVDIAGNRPDVAAALANKLDAQVVPMPNGESAPDADMLVITGIDSSL